MKIGVIFMLYIAIIVAFVLFLKALEAYGDYWIARGLG